MITEIMIHSVEELEIEASRLPVPALNCTSITINIGVSNLDGHREWQKITLFAYDKADSKFEDSELARKIKVFNEVECLDASWVK